MISKPLVVVVWALICVGAAAGGAYVAVRQNAPASQPAQAMTTTHTPDGTAAAKPVAETEAVVTPPTPAPATAPASPVLPEKAAPSARVERPTETPKKAKKEASAQPPARSAQNGPSSPAVTEHPAAAPREPVNAPSTVAPAAPAPVEPIATEPPPPPKPVFVEVVVPASSVVGLQVETSVTSETARVEDRVEARVTRDVMADGRVAIPAGSKVIGDVTLVERGGKMKDKARLGVRFHTVVLADGHHLSLRSESIYREGSSPGAESARKIGGATAGGAILGAIIGGAKGAAIGGATGAAGGSAVVMAGDRNPATLPSGTIVNVRLSSPVSVDVEKEQ
jgi:hypothetical protein